MAFPGNEFFTDCDIFLNASEFLLVEEEVIKFNPFNCEIWQTFSAFQTVKNEMCGISSEIRNELVYVRVIQVFYIFGAFGALALCMLLAGGNDYIIEDLERLRKYRLFGCLAFILFLAEMLVVVLDEIKVNSVL